MLGILQRLIITMGAAGSAVLAAVAAGMVLAAADAIYHQWFLGRTIDSNETLTLMAAGAAFAFVVSLPIFLVIDGLLRKERELEAMVGELRDTRDRLSISEARFRHIAEAASDWFWEMDTDMRFTYFSPRVAEIVGVPVEFHLGKTRAELAGEEVHSEKWQRHLDDLTHHRPFRDFRFVRKGHDGRLQTLTSSGKPLFDSNGDFSGYIGVGSDITRQLEVAEIARLAQERLANAIDELSELFVLWGPDDRLVICNEQFRRINAEVIETTEPGTLFADHIRTALDNGLYPSAIGREDEWLADRMARHASPGEAFELERQDGRWLHIREQRFPDGSVATVSTNITERKKSEVEMMAAKEAAEAANRSKSDFLARMSHELRTPLNAILGFSQIIRDETFGPMGVPAYADYAKDINTSGEMLLSLINDLLDLSRIEAGKYEIEVTAVDLRAAAMDVLRLFEREAASVKISLENAIADDLPMVRADLRSVRQMLMNLLSNALKFSQPGGAVKVDAMANSDGLAVIVTDTGVGFAPSRMKTILAPFGRLDQAATATAGGAGLGLPIVKSLMDLHGGTIELFSLPGEGTTAILNFPADRLLGTVSEAAEAD